MDEAIYELDEDQLDGLSDGGFKITDDKTADWAVGVIKKERAECERLCSLCDERIAYYTSKKRKLQDSCEIQTSSLLLKLKDFFQSVKPKEMKSQWSYSLIAGKLVQPKAKLEYKRNDEELVQWLQKNHYDQYVKVSKSVAWADLKKNLTGDAEHGLVTMATGEVVDGISAELVPGNFDVK